MKRILIVTATIAVTATLQGCAGLQAIGLSAPDTVGGYSYEQMEELGYLDLEPGACLKLQSMHSEEAIGLGQVIKEDVSQCKLAIRKEKKRERVEAEKLARRQERDERLAEREAEIVQAHREAKAKDQRKAVAWKQAQTNITKRVAATKASNALQSKAGKNITPSLGTDIDRDLVVAVACMEIEYQAQDVKLRPAGGDDFIVTLTNAITNAGRRDITLNVVDAGDRYLLASYSTGGFPVTYLPFKDSLIFTSGRGLCSQLVESQKLLGVAESDYSTMIKAPIL